MAPVGSFHLVRVPVQRRVATVARLPLDRPRLTATSGLAMGRELATDKGSSTRMAIDLSRWAAFTVWECEADLDAWERTSPLLRRWRRHAIEHWSVRLDCLTAHGHWRGTEPFPGMAGVARDVGREPVAVLTRSKVRLSRLARFYRSTSDVAHAVSEAEGRLQSVGFAEWPIGRHGTFSLWRSTDDLTAFAYGHSQHRDVVQRSRAERWYGEELFARFRPYRSSGTWEGQDPLA